MTSEGCTCLTMRAHGAIIEFSYVLCQEGRVRYMYVSLWSRKSLVMHSKSAMTNEDERV
jgi:hypothetical protein